MAALTNDFVFCITGILLILMSVGSVIYFKKQDKKHSKQI